MLLLAVVLGNLVAAAGAATAGPAAVPVVLVHGWGRDSELAWGWPSGRAGSLYGRLLDHGYDPAMVGAFEWSRRDADYLAAAEALGQVVSRLLEQTQASQLDLLTDCMGAVIGRALALDPGFSARIRNIVMISPPNLGSDQTHVYGHREFVHRLEARRRADGRYRAAHAPLWDPPDATSVEDYVYWRSYLLYEPLYGEFIWGERMVPGPISFGTGDFYGWFSSREPEALQALMATARGPLVPPIGEVPGSRLPAAESYLDLAYLELLALKAGSHLYRALVSPLEGITRDWHRDIQPADDWRVTAIRFVALRLISFVREVGLPWLEFALRDSVVGALARWGIGPGEVPWPVLVPELIRWPGTNQPDVMVAANLALTEMNRYEESMRSQAGYAGPRHVTVVSASSRGTGVFTSGLVADSSLFLAAAVQGDAVIPFGGGRVHPGRRDVQVAVIDVLDRTSPVAGSVRSAFGPAASSGDPAPPASSVPTLPASVMGEFTEAGDAPLVRVIRTSKMTTTKQERRIAHELWQWEWECESGATGAWVDPRSGDPEGEFVLPATGNRVRVTARSISNEDRLLRELEWHVGPDGADGVEGAMLRADGDSLRWEFVAESIREPQVDIEIQGPENWVAGREALYQISADITMPPHADEATVYYYPGQRFRVLWERPGTFTVRAAVNLRFSYRLPERSLYVSVIYVAEREVEVLATSVTR